MGYNGDKQSEFKKTLKSTIDGEASTEADPTKSPDSDEMFSEKEISEIRKFGNDHYVIDEQNASKFDTTI